MEKFSFVECDEFFDGVSAAVAAREPQVFRVTILKRFLSYCVQSLTRIVFNYYTRIVGTDQHFPFEDKSSLKLSANFPFEDKSSLELSTTFQFEHKSSVKLSTNFPKVPLKSSNPDEVPTPTWWVFYYMKPCSILQSNSNTFLTVGKSIWSFNCT